MEAITLAIAIHGLIVLAPTFENETYYMTALLVDAREPHSMEGMDMEGMEMCPSEHHPELRFLAKKSAECISAGCTASGNRCICTEEDLVRKHISLKFDPDFNPPTQAPDTTPIAQGIPSNPAEAGRFSNVANLSQEPFGLTLDPEHLGVQPSSAVVSRMKVHLQDVTACTLAGREDAGQTNVQLMSFRSLHEPSQQDEMSQALAQKVVLGLSIPQDTKIFLHISDFDGVTNSKAIELLAGSRGYQIDLSNQPSRALDRDHPCNDGVSRHFGMYYALAQKPLIEHKERLLPRFRFTQGIRRSDIEPIVCKNPMLGLIDRPACPVATFNP